MEINNIAIIGLGLIGGSLAKALKKANNKRKITGIDNNHLTIEQALKAGVIDKGSTKIDKLLYDADIVFICTPVSCINSYIEELRFNIKDGCILTDTGSIKSGIIEYVEKLTGEINFVGGHPMCGSEECGYSSSKAHLFENAYYVLTPCSKTFKDTTAKLEKILIEIGAIPVIIDSRKHDIVAGAISHVPHVMSAALVNLIKELEYEEGYMKKLAAGGFRDLTRISSSKPEMWQNVVFSNKANVIKILEDYIDKLSRFKNSVENDDKDEVLHFFESAKDFRDSFNSNRIGLLTPFHDVTIDIEDRPGQLAQITALLHNENINIKNISISNNREQDAGCLRITLSEAYEVEKACSILSTYGYKVYKG